MQWFVGTTKNDSYAEDAIERSCAHTSYSLPAAPVDLWRGHAGKEGPARGLNGTGVGTTGVGGCSVGQVGDIRPFHS
jgi:hypothetical protein